MNYSSDDNNSSQHAIASANLTGSDEDIVDYNDTYKIFQLFTAVTMHRSADSLDAALNSKELESISFSSNNFTSHEKKILLRSILI